MIMLAGGLQHHFHTRDMRKMSGLWAKLLKMSSMPLFLSIAALSVPRLGNFIGEFLSLLGAFQANHVAAIFAAMRLTFASVYSLWVFQRVSHGNTRCRIMASHMGNRIRILLLPSWSALARWLSA
jgi:NADH-quinone oxidoreductase subunit M